MSYLIAGIVAYVLIGLRVGRRTLRAQLTDHSICRPYDNVTLAGMGYMAFLAALGWPIVAIGWCAARLVARYDNRRRTP